jgi:choline dehydrogenase-like flavoprotein
VAGPGAPRPDGAAAVSKPSVIIVGSGAGGSVAAWGLATAGHPVLILEKGRSVLPGLGGPGPIRTLFANDDIKAGRAFENQDSVLEPRSFRTHAEAANGKARSFVGDVNNLPTVVGGGTVHWDAKVPRFWRHDFKGLSLYGPVPDANVADWPLTYEDLAPFYDEVEIHLGVQGDVTRMPARTLEQAPRAHQFPMPPNPPMYAGKLLVEGAKRLGYTLYPFPMAVNSQAYDGRPRCNSCGFCSGYGCPINARGGAAVSFLHHALRAGAELRPRCFVYRVDMASKGHAAGVSYLDPEGHPRSERADILVLAPSGIELARLLLLSANSDHLNGLGNRSGQVGRNLMFHFFTVAGAFFRQEVHGTRGPSTTFTTDDFVGPDRPPEARAAGLPYIKGGICESGGSIPFFQEMGLYAGAFPAGGSGHKGLMRMAPLRRHAVGLSMVGEDLPQLASRVDLDPQLRDVYGFAVPRITKSAHRHEIVASLHYGPMLQAICEAAPGAVPGAGAYIPVGILSDSGPGSPVGSLATTAHIMGTARMGLDPASSVTDEHGRLHEVDNVYVGDGSVFVSAGGFNPSITIMALSLRMARHIAGTGPAVTTSGATVGALPNTQPGDSIGAAGAAVTLTAAAVAGAARRRTGKSDSHDDAARSADLPG